MRAPILLGIVISSACSAPHSTPPPIDLRIAKVESFRAMQAVGELDAARALLGEDPRTWWDERAGEGSPWVLGGGRWSAWDWHFNSSAERATPWGIESDCVWADMLENNDYFRLVKSTARVWRGTYFFDERGMLNGFLISSQPTPRLDTSRSDEFEAWALARHPAESQYLMPAGEIDATGDRPVRMRALLDEWRAEVGLPTLRGRGEQSTAGERRLRGGSPRESCSAVQGSPRA